MGHYFDKGEALLVADDKDTATREAFAILFAGGKDKIQDGLKKYEEMRTRQVRQYLDRLNWATMDRAEQLNPTLRPYAGAGGDAGNGAEPTPGTVGRILTGTD